MPYPPRTTVFEKSFQAKPRRGAKLFLSGRTRLAGSGPLYGPGCPATTRATAAVPNAGFKTPGDKSRFASRLLISENGDTYSYRTPRFNVRLLRTFHSSCAYKSHEFPRK